MHLRKSLVAAAGLTQSSLALAIQDQSPLGIHLYGNSEVTIGRRPNVILILTDDQDLHMNSLDYMPLLQKHMADQGAQYKKHFCTTAICCPARVSLLTGRLAHNTNVTDVYPPYGGYPKFVSNGFNDAYLPVWLQAAGYDTYYTGKLFNAHTVQNYNKPWPRGWTQSDFLLDPFTYAYYNSSFQRNRDPPRSYEGQHSVDVLAEKSYAFLKEAAKADKPFFLGIAPPAPHTDVEFNWATARDSSALHLGGVNATVTFRPPVPAHRHEHLFQDARIPRTENFNPKTPSDSARWIQQRPPVSSSDLELYDHFYRQRLRTLQSVDELVDGLFDRLDRLGLLDNTYVFYTTDNGFHIGHHRLPPGKECGFEEDINVPLLVRGPGVPAGTRTDVVTTHTDLVPTILKLAGAALPEDLDGTAIPLSREDLYEAQATRHEHVTIEHWGFANYEGGELDIGLRIPNNTYKAVRIVSPDYNLYYSVWCSGEHELYDLKTDPYQRRNLVSVEGSKVDGVPLHRLISRLDSLIMVLKSCKGATCARPWVALHPQGNVQTLHDALSHRFDAFYSLQQRVGFDRCELGYIVDAEGPQFDNDGLVYQDGVRASEWV
ncbi:alkaline-phosphatase-like protein [Fusarium solani]|uniref:Arylsulfatase n=1 Tax=Fusarium solani TaxID=169388 RepID=A0A9P9H977_FUSSL|nr:alkaline-phosphatase-like protein [Fusarium solani]KAH7253278.1 alkaline-phosphatase-like protein [Fusarium solani]